MNLLVTAGNTLMPIDKVRCITNIFSGRTGANLAVEGCRRGHRVRIVTSHPDVVVGLLEKDFDPAALAVESYRTFDDLCARLETLVRGKEFDAIIHAAAVGDYRAAGIFSLAEPTQFDSTTGAIRGRFVDRSAGKVKSDEPELWLRLTRTPKLIDLFREPWGFTGTLVKFKLEVDKTEAELESIAERSRVQSRADLMVANTLEGSADWALVGPLEGRYHHVSRGDLSRYVLDAVEQDVAGTLR